MRERGKVFEAQLHNGRLRLASRRRGTSEIMRCAYVYITTAYVYVYIIINNKKMENAPRAA